MLSRTQRRSPSPMCASLSKTQRMDMFWLIVFCFARGQFGSKWISRISQQPKWPMSKCLAQRMTFCHCITTCTLVLFLIKLAKDFTTLSSSLLCCPLKASWITAPASYSHRCQALLMYRTPVCCLSTHFKHWGSTSLLSSINPPLKTAI